MKKVAATGIQSTTTLIESIKRNSVALAATLILALMSPALVVQADTTLENEANETQNWVEVTDPYIEFHTGPGQRYPIVYVVEKGESVEVDKEKTGWFKVTNQEGKSGWVNRSQMEKTLHLDGKKFIVTDIGEDEFSQRVIEAGVAIGGFEGASAMSVYMDYRFSETLSAEISLNQINGSFSNSKLISVGFINQPFSHWKVSPFMFLGSGVIQTTPNTTLVQSEQRTDQIVTVGIGVKAYLTKRFVLRAEYKEHIVLTDRSENEVVGEWKTGFSVFF